MIRLLKGLSVDENRSSFLSGVWDVLPVFTGIVPFAMIVGITAVELGFTAVEVSVMSATVFAGASQLAALFLMAESVHVVLVVLTAVVVNLRFSMYSASLAPKFRSRSRVRKAVYSFLLVDQVYALTVSRSRDRDGDRDRSHWYYFGSGLASWVAWVLGTVVGASMGVGVPAAFPVDLVLPLVFVALLFPVVEDRPDVATAVVAGGVAVVAAPLDYNAGLLLGVGCGLAVGVGLDR